MLVDLPADARRDRGRRATRDGVTPRGKAGPAAAHGARQGINDYTGWFAGDHDMGGDYYGYDGPCPPWNDEIRAPLRVHASTRSTSRAAAWKAASPAPEVRAAIEGHVLAQASRDRRLRAEPRRVAVADFRGVQRIAAPSTACVALHAPRRAPTSASA
ncbi:MAG: hypothetical protein MZW92_29500 [Comamonadaceae bacterium]|nr:hypothetical protein [Comamonadaceae bacterium]